MALEGPGKEARILTAKATGRASFEAERLYGRLPEQEFVGDFIRADPPRGRKGLLSLAMNALQSGEKLVVLTGQGGIGLVDSSPAELGAITLPKVPVAAMAAVVSRKPRRFIAWSLYGDTNDTRPEG